MSYQSNNISELKREALRNFDIDALTQIRKFEHTNKAIKTYYVLEDEAIIRDSEGNVIDPADLPFRQQQTFERFIPMYAVSFVGRSSERAGQLWKDITNDEDRDLSVILLEVPRDTAFPIPERFNWVETCKAAISNRNAIGEPFLRTDRHRLDGTGV